MNTRHASVENLTPRTLAHMCEQTGATDIEDMQAIVLDIYYKYRKINATSRFLNILPQYIKAVLLSNNIPINRRGGPNNVNGRGGLPRKYLTHEGRTLCHSAWAKESKISPQLLHVRLYELGWPLKKALETPVSSQKQRRTRTTTFTKHRELPARLISNAHTHV